MVVVIMCMLVQCTCYHMHIYIAQRQRSDESLWHNLDFSLQCTAKRKGEECCERQTGEEEGKSIPRQQLVEVLLML